MQPDQSTHQMLWCKVIHITFVNPDVMAIDYSHKGTDSKGNQVCLIYSIAQFKLVARSHALIPFYQTLRGRSIQGLVVFVQSLTGPWACIVLILRTD